MGLQSNSSNPNLNTNLSDGTNDNGGGSSPSNKMYYKDAILIRFKGEKKEENYVRVLSDTEFINEFKRRANDQFWMQIDSIQTTIKSKIGLGKPFNFTFNAPCYKKDPVTGNILQSYDGDIEFDFK